jgi:cytochrome P450
MRLPGPRTPIDYARHAVALTRTPAEHLRELHRDYGPVVAFGIRPFRYVGLFGPDANRYLLAENTENFRWREALAMLIPVDGDTALVVSDGEDHRRRRQLVQPAFATRRIASYFDVMVDEVDREIDTWRDGEVRDVFASMRRAIRRIAVRSLFGDSLGARADELGDALAGAIDFVNRPPQEQLRIDLPGTPWHRARVARDRADAIVNAEIARRRRAPPPETTRDVLDALVAPSDDGTEPLSDVEIRDQVVSLVAAGYDTTSAAAAWAVHELLANDGEWKRAAVEIEAVVGDDRLSTEHLGRLPHLDAVVHETLRLWPPGFISARKAVGAFEFGGYEVPAGSIVIYSPYVTQRDPRWWPEPDRFVPERWRDLEPEPYTFVPFGGGYRRCIGFAFATQELKVVLAQLLRRVACTRLPGSVRPVGSAALHPKGGVPVRIDRVA